ncbi:MAG: type IV toxin-antitoxin system AbiEi family antitoxin domain-containing protein [Acidimicrobiales bacterium]
MDPFRRVTASAAQQHGLVAREQVLATGVSASMLKRWAAQGRLEVVHAGVYRLAGSPDTWEQRLLATVLAAPDAAASHRSAARLWELGSSDELEMSVPACRRPTVKGVRLHRVADLDRATIVHRSGIPTTNPTRTLVDLGAVYGPNLVEEALDRALTRRIITVDLLERELELLARPGRNGVGVLRVVLDRRAIGAERPDSVLEARMARLLRAWSLPPAAFQYEVRVGGRLVARVDFAYPELRLAIEVDGWETHSSPRELQYDLDRQNALVAAGWIVLRFTWVDVVRRPAKVAARIRAALATIPVTL